MSGISPIYLKQFINDLQHQLCKSLKRKGSCIKRGKLLVSLESEKYLETKFEITKRFKISNILNLLLIDQNIVKDHDDLDPATITDFKIKFGNKTITKYHTRPTDSVTLKRELTGSRIFHWEFKRVVLMGQTSQESDADLDARYEARTAVRKQQYC